MDVFILFYYAHYAFEFNGKLKNNSDTAPFFCFSNSSSASIFSLAIVDLNLGLNKIGNDRLKPF